MAYGVTAYKQSYQNKGQFSKKTRCVSYETVFIRSIVCRRGIYCFELSSGLFSKSDRRKLFFFVDRSFCYFVVFSLF